MTLTAQSQVFTWQLYATSTWFGTAWFSRLGQDFIPVGPPIHWCSKPWILFILPLPFGLKGYWLFLLAISLFFPHILSLSLFFLNSLLFLVSRIIFMIFQIINDIFPFPSFFQEPKILTFINNKFKNMHCSSIHSENKKCCHHIKIIKLF